MKKFPAILCALVLCLMCATAMAEGESHPKYVFMFIGDGMGNPQVTATQYYLGSIENPDSKFPVPADLSFTKFRFDRYVDGFRQEDALRRLHPILHGGEPYHEQQGWTVLHLLCA